MPAFSMKAPGVYSPAVISPDKDATGPGPDRMARNRERRHYEGAGRTTATARADMGARNWGPTISMGPGLRTVL